MSLFKSNKNKTSSAASTPAQTPRPSVDAQRPSQVKMTRDQALELALRNSVQNMPANFSLFAFHHANTELNATLSVHSTESRLRSNGLDESGQPTSGSSARLWQGKCRPHYHRLPRPRSQEHLERLQCQTHNTIDSLG
ncbi:MAG: hypothetical protein JOS17DRAFT_819479 [Linnemannia elongata]|nr:MAG: hypothetical protein JOS17DRAFT_823229 [Linnemannia elongata]KAK3822312.1 MAG: hypothetical protein JOS17DRAFT_819479 [Linnemannia elongata]